MNSRITIAVLSTVMALASSAMADDNVTAYSYNDGTYQDLWWGTGLKDTYDVAIFLQKPEFVGAEVVGVRVSVPASTDVSDYSAWLSNALSLDSDDLNVADIASKDGEAQEGVLEILFDTPYTLTEQGVYVGYSFKVNSAKKFDGKYPLTVAKAANPGAFYIHTGRTYLKWKDISEEEELLLSMQVLLRGDFTSNSLKAVSLSEINTVADTDTSATLQVCNTGVNAVSSVGYTLTCGDKTISDVMELSPVLSAQYGKVSTIEIPVPAAAETGIYPLQVTIDTVNGEANADSEATAGNNLYVVEYLPKHNAYMEEFTGTWCSWCPIGFVAMELLNERHEDFIGVAYHCGDVMSMKRNIPDPAIGYPMASIDREVNCSPYYGPDDYCTDFGMEPYWESCCQTFTPFDISMQADFTDAERTAVKMDVTVKSVKPLTGDYRIEYVLVEDGMHGSNSAWYQCNSYGGDESYRGLEGMDFFIDQGYIVKGLTFNDVAVMNTGNLGVEGSLPETLEAGTTYSASHTFTLADAKNTADSPLIQDPTGLRAVALVVLNDGSKLGKVMNAAKCRFPSLDGVRDLLAGDAAEVAETIWYDLQGNRIQNPDRGLYIKVEKLTDNTHRTRKVVL